MDAGYETECDISSDAGSDVGIDNNVSIADDLANDTGIDLNDSTGDSADFCINEAVDDETDDDLNETKGQAERHGCLAEDMAKPDLFADNKGDCTYYETDHGKGARGSLEISDDRKRNQRAQLAAGGEDREEYDDGGHLIGARYGGSPTAENLDAQNRDVNRRGFKGAEDEWASDLKDGNNVFVNIENYNSNGSERPDATMGYSITEDKDGNRTWDAFSFQNASFAEQDEWANIVDETAIDDTFLNPMRDADYIDEDAHDN